MLYKARFVLFILSQFMINKFVLLRLKLNGPLDISVNDPASKERQYSKSEQLRTALAEVRNSMLFKPAVEAFSIHRMILKRRCIINNIIAKEGIKRLHQTYCAMTICYFCLIKKLQVSLPQV